MAIYCGVSTTINRSISMSVIIPGVKHPVFDRWVSALNDHNVDAICNLYSDNAILIPAISNTIRHKRDDIRDYYEGFLSKEDLRAELANCHVCYENGHKIDTGNYLFTWNEGGEIVSAKARFSFLIDQEKIIVHHSSIWPEG